MRIGSIRIAPLAGFECSVDEFRQLVGNSGQPEHQPFPHGDVNLAIVPCAGDTVRYGPALLLKGALLRVVQFTLEDSSESHSCLAAYGRQYGPRRMLVDGSWSARVQPFSIDESAEQVHELCRLAKAYGLNVAENGEQCEVVLLVRHDGCKDRWESDDNFR